ncbi:MAG TPA: hypothetical protein VMW29_00410 [Candidatus Bathyarchaeia archaeon]|nr:hypothetical protein [Candidatus Bathyarchaeia archaeon]
MKEKKYIFGWKGYGLNLFSPGRLVLKFILESLESVSGRVSRSGLWRWGLIKGD